MIDQEPRTHAVIACTVDNFGGFSEKRTYEAKLDCRFGKKWMLTGEINHIGHFETWDDVIRFVRVSMRATDIEMLGD